MRILQALAALFPSALLLSCSDPDPIQSGSPESADALPARYVQSVANGALTETERDRVLDKGRQAANALVQNLLNAQLKSAMEAGGPANAIQVCQQVALPMTESTAKAFEGVTIRRTSLKVRNPANAPDSIDRELLEAWQVAHDAGQTLPEEDIVPGEGGARYYKPIHMKALCLNCHGVRDTLQPEVVELLKQFYPGDNAHGYQEGDFRGVVRVDVTLAGAED